MALEDLIASLFSQKLQANTAEKGFDTRRYEADSQSGTARYNADAQKYGADLDAASKRYGLDLDRYKTELGLPLQYGAMFNQQYSPMYGYGTQQGQNMTSLGNTGMGLYGTLSNQQSQMYQSELPLMAEQQKFNALAPVLGNLLSGLGLGDISIPSVSYTFNRPDVMGGYQHAMDSAYSNARGYDSWMSDYMSQQGAKMPTTPQVSPVAPQYQSPAQQSPRAGGGVFTMGQAPQVPTPQPQVQPTPGVQYKASAYWKDALPGVAPSAPKTLAGVRPGVAPKR